MRGNRILVIIITFFLLLISYSALGFVIKTTATSNTGTTYRAVLVGISDYPGTDNDLTTPVNGVYAIENCLRQSSGYYSITKLIDSAATLNNVRNKLNWLKEDTDDDDVSIFYYCGHGTQRDTLNRDQEGDYKDECFALYDDVMHDDEFIERILEIKGYIYIIIDTCFGAGFEEDLDYNIVGPLVSQSKVTLITAFDENQHLFAVPEMNYGFLTFHLVGGLSISADTDNSITIDDVYMFANLIFEQGRPLFGYGGGDSEGINVYPTRGTSRYYANAYIPIIKGFTNYYPEIIEFNVPDKPKKECKIELKLCDIDDDSMKIFIDWGDGRRGWENGLYYNGGSVTLTHTFSEYKKYKISVIVKDSKGAISNWETQEVTIEKKASYPVFSDRLNFVLSKLINHDTHNLINKPTNPNIIIYPEISNNIIKPNIPSIITIPGTSDIINQPNIIDNIIQPEAINTINKIGTSNVIKITKK